MPSYNVGKREQIRKINDPPNEVNLSALERRRPKGVGVPQTKKRKEAESGNELYDSRIYH